MPSIKIHPLNLGTITRQTMTFGYWLDPGKVIDAPLIAWYIEGSNKKILVDTGGGDPAKAHPRYLPYRREKEQSIENALKKIGVRCEEIEIVVATHLHWDHSAGNDLFPHAKIIVQEEELNYARSPFPANAHGYIKHIVEEVEYTVISGDEEIAEGIQLIFTPGHTYGMQGVLVEASHQKRYFIAGDTFGLFRNLESHPPLISGIYVDMRQYYETLNKISKLSAFILPGHDARVFDQEVYL
jgi:glyoxylase-like metal-dependent hydrolase (beta-lactamase superfamily II)